MPSLSHISWMAEEPPEPSDGSCAGLEMSIVQDPGWVSGNFRPVAKTSFSLSTMVTGDRAELALVGE